MLITPDIKATLARYDAAKTRRENWDPHWQEVAERVFPSHAEFYNTAREPGSRRHDRIYDSSPILGLARGAAAMDGLMTPRSQKWHHLLISNPNLRENANVKRWLDEVVNVLFRLRYAAQSGFVGANSESWVSYMAFGSAPAYIEPAKNGRGIRYRSLFLGDSYFAEDDTGQIVYFYRRRNLNAAQAVARFGKDKLPRDIVRDYEKGNQSTAEYLQTVEPNTMQDRDAWDWREMPFSTMWMLNRGNEPEILDVGGFEEWPIPLARHMLSPVEVYGRGIAMELLPEIKMLGQIRKTSLRAAQLVTQPPMLAPMQGIFGPASLSSGSIQFDLQPNGVTYGGVDAAGNQLIHPLRSDARPDIGQAFAEDSREIIKDGFFGNLFSVLMEKRQMTATEVLERVQERGVLLSPIGARHEDGYLGPTIHREFGIAMRLGLLPPPPPEVIEAGGDYEVEYDSPLSRAQRAEEAIAIQRSADFCTQVSAFDPAAHKRIKWNEAIKVHAEVSGVPAEVIRSDDEYKELMAASAEEQQAAQMVEAAPQLAQAGKTLVEAEALSGA